MNYQLKVKLRQIRDRILWEKYFFNRGKSIVSDLMEIILGMASLRITVQGVNGLFHTNLDADKAMLIVPLLLIVYWRLGRLDFFKLHLIQKEGEIGNIANPSLYEKIIRIDENIQEIKNKK